MLARIALVASAVLLAFVLGVTTFAPAPPPVGLAHPLRVASLRLEPPGAANAAAAAALAGFHPPPAPPAPLLAAAPPPPPMAPRPIPPPEPAAVLRASLAAVTDDHGRLGLVLSGPFAGRRLHEGDAFMGWRLASVTRNGAVLNKGGERREVSFFAPASRGAATAAGASPGILPPPVAAPASRPPTAAEFFRGYKG